MQDILIAVTSRQLTHVPSNPDGPSIVGPMIVTGGFAALIVLMFIWQGIKSLFRYVKAWAAE